MKLSILATSFLTLVLANSAHSATTFTSDKVLFNNLTSTTLVEDFESIAPTPKDTAIASFTSNGITYTGLAGTPFPNVFVSSPGYTNYEPPGMTTSSILTGNGDEDYTLEFSTAVTAVGFDTYINTSGPAMVSVFGNGGLLDTFNHSHDPATVGFLGILAMEDIKSIRWTTTNGAVVNTGIDNIRTGAVIPIPAAAWLFGSTLLGLAGIGRRKQA